MVPEDGLCAGGDAFISICMWQAGFAVTDPGYSFYHPEVQMMDPGPEDRLGIMMKLSRALGGTGVTRCDERCQVRRDAFCAPLSVVTELYALYHLGDVLAADVALCGGRQRMPASPPHSSAHPTLP